MSKKYPNAWPARGPSKEEWLPSAGGIGTGDIGDPPLNLEWAQKRLVNALADGRLGNPKAVARLASDLGWSEQFLIDRMGRSDIRREVISKIRMKALQAVAGAIEDQAEAAKTDIAAYKLMLQTAEVLTQSGPHVNVAIDARKMGDTNSDRAFFEATHRRIEAMHDPVPEDPPTPEEAVVGAEPENLEDTEPLPEPETGQAT